MCGPVQDGLYCESLWNPAKIWCSPNLLRFDPTWKEALASCNFGRYACVCAPGPCKATYGRLLPRWPVEALASFSCASLYTTFHTHNFVTRIFHTQLYHTQLFTYNFLTSRSSTTSFVFPSFPVPLQLVFLLVGRSWLVGLSGPLIVGIAWEGVCTYVYAQYSQCTTI